jgi:hypothetical protein
MTNAKHPPGPPMTLGNMCKMGIGLLASLATSAGAITPVPLHLPEG